MHTHMQPWMQLMRHLVAPSEHRASPFSICVQSEDYATMEPIKANDMLPFLGCSVHVAAIFLCIRAVRAGRISHVRWDPLRKNKLGYKGSMASQMAER